MQTFCFCSYETSRQRIDAIFGQKVHPSFPRQLNPCNNNNNNNNNDNSRRRSGCGHYPSTLGGVFNEGIDLVAEPPLSSVTMPLSGYAQPFNSSATATTGRSDLYGLLFPATPSGSSGSSVSGGGDSGNYSRSNTIVVTPLESSHTGVYIVLSNLQLSSSLVRDDNEGEGLRFFSAGDVIGTATTADSAANNDRVVHVEVIKVIDGVAHRLDPTSYLQPRLDPRVDDITLQCNDVVLRSGGVVVQRSNLVGVPVVARELLGEPLVVGE